jgi:microcystin-dependent protein
MTERVIKPATTAPNGGYNLPFSLNAIAQAGMIVPYAGDINDPLGWRICDGRSLLVSNYSALFAIIGYTYGGAGLNFNLPDLRGEFIRVFNATGIGEDTGRSMGSFQTSTIEQHSHGALSGSIDSGGSGHTHPYSVSLAADSNSYHTHYHYVTDGCGSYCFDDALFQPSGSISPSTDWAVIGYADEGRHGHSYTLSSSSSGTHTHGHSFSNTNSTGTDTKPRNVALSYIIKI